MRLLKPVLLTIFLLALLQCTLQSQDSLFTQPTIATFNSSVKVSGQLNNELKLYNHPFDLTKLEIRDYNDLPCEIESIIENRDPIFLTLFIDANTSDEKLDFF